MSKPKVESPVALAVTDSVKRYGSVIALDGASAEIRDGDWVGLIGPNGAGKTTLMLAVAGLLPLDSGSITVCGEPVKGPRPSAVGWIPQQIALYPTLTPRENLRAFGRFHGLTPPTLGDRIDWALSWTGLQSRADDRVDSFSGGMKRRLNIACGVLHRPRLVLLDEPTVGVDPQARERIFAMLEALRADGATLLHSSHELGDVEAKCDRLIVMDRGKSVAAGTVDDLIRRTVGEATTLRVALSGLPDGLPGLQRDSGSAGWTRSLDDVALELPEFLEQVRRQGGRVTRLEIRRPGLTEVFVALTGKELRE